MACGFVYLEGTDNNTGRVRTLCLENGENGMSRPYQGMTVVGD